MGLLRVDRSLDSPAAAELAFTAIRAGRYTTRSFFSFFGGESRWLLETN